MRFDKQLAWCRFRYWGGDDLQARASVDNCFLHLMCHCEWEVLDKDGGIRRCRLLRDVTNISSPCLFHCHCIGSTAQDYDNQLGISSAQEILILEICENGLRCVNVVDLDWWALLVSGSPLPSVDKSNFPKWNQVAEKASDDDQ